MGGEAALGMQGFGAGMSTVGAYYNAVGQKSTLNAQAHIDDVNSKISDMSTQSAILSGQREEQKVKLNTAQIKSSQKTAMAANGIDLSSTTPVAVLTSTDTLGEIDAATVSANAMRTAFGYQTQSLNFQNKARGERATAKGINPWMSAAGTAIAGASTVSQSWYSLKKEGAFDTKPSSSDVGPQNDWFARNFGQHNLVSDALY